MHVPTAQQVASYTCGSMPLPAASVTQSAPVHREGTARASVPNSHAFVAQCSLLQQFDSGRAPADKESAGLRQSLRREDRASKHRSAHSSRSGHDLADPQSAGVTLVGLDYRFGHNFFLTESSSPETWRLASLIGWTTLTTPSRIRSSSSARRFASSGVCPFASSRGLVPVAVEYSGPTLFPGPAD